MVCLIRCLIASELTDIAASKFMIDTGAGVVDADYRGVIFVLLINHSEKDFQGILCWLREFAPSLIQ